MTMTTNLAERYADLLPGADPRTTRLISQLHTLYETRDFPERLSVAYLSLGRPVDAAPAGRRPGWSRPRLATLLAAAILVLTGAGYAVSSFLASTWQRDPGLDRVFRAGLVSELQLSQTVDGVTITLERAYADVSRIAIGFSVEAPIGLGGQVSAGAPSVELRDASGRVFRPTIGHGYADARSPFGATVVVFDAAPLSAEAGPLQLELSIREVRTLGTSVRGPWQFQFPLRIVPARVATATLMESSGVKVDVRLVVAPSETRLYLDVDDPLGRSWNPTGVRLESGGRSYREAWGSCPEGACTTFGFIQPFADDVTEWVVTVESLELVGAYRSGSEPTSTIAGPWRLRLLPK